MRAAVIAAFLVALTTGSYLFGRHHGRNSEELKNARAEISEMQQTLQEFKTRQTNDAVSLAELRVAESRARDEYEWMRSQLAILESRASKNNASGSCIRFQRLAVEKEQLLNEAQRGLEFCYKNHR
ncbi:hypothetical protein [uncultured Parasutterella sp.]|uniref:hypothetical protein n=1 Tax=uncultured Parasutterella sp. TaxID=1263098 RepID=UPI0025B663A1|nr:hypothetical protein [uncultured Parasutterella sp.]